MIIAAINRLKKTVNHFLFQPNILFVLIQMIVKSKYKNHRFFIIIFKNDEKS